MFANRPTFLLTILAFLLIDRHCLTFGQERQIDFAQDIRPILNEHCLACHGGVKQAADVSFIHRDAALAVIEPGQPDSSALIERVRAEDESEVMPPPEHGPRLSDDQVAMLEQWIQQGAQWMQPWAYEKPVRPSVPVLDANRWSNGPLDRFVLARLHQESLQPASEAPPEQWLRRVWLDLIGVPPTPGDVDDFLVAVQREGEPAYRRAVDRLLASPKFGERWASVWLDQIRYADSRGLGLDGRREIWAYRDWVIDAINQDMPFDEFTIKQLAGDLLPNPSIDDLVATAANRLTQTNEEGGTDDEEFRINAVIDRVSTVWQTWQGITFGCVQCHAHPYDPIQHDEFYRFVAFFNNTTDCDLSEDLPLLNVPLNRDDLKRANELDREIQSLEESIFQRESPTLRAEFAQWQPITQLQATADKDTKIETETREGVTEFRTVDTLSSDTTITLTAGLPANLSTLSAVRLTIAPRNVSTARSDSEWGFVLSHISASLVPTEGEPRELRFTRVIGDEPHPFMDPDESLNPKSSNGFSAYSRIHYPRQAVLVLESPVEIPPGANLVIRLENRVTVLGAFPLVARRGSVDVTNQSAIADLLRDSQLQSDSERLRSLRLERKSIPAVATPITRELPTHLARPTHVFIRGLFLTKDKEVTPAVPEAFTQLPAEVPANRLAMARWLVDGNNPLTARVFANRIWSRLFGIGLVATEEDFGSSGDMPSHGELLDYLATTFQREQAWSLKQLVKSIVLSSTYRQDSATREELMERDPQNRLLARGPRFRMPAEMVRDQALAVAGLMSHEMHGPPVHPPIPAGVWTPFQGGDKWQTPGPDDGDRYRRSIYTYTKRSIPFPMFAAFDAPSREFCTPRRLRSNTPLQALMTLNDATFVECSRAFADELLRAHDSLAAQVEFGFRAITTRSPNERESRALQDLYQRCKTDNATDQDAMTAVASVLLNLDEITSK